MSNLSSPQQGNFSSPFPLAVWALLGYSAPVYLFGSNDSAAFTSIPTTAVGGAPICASPPSSMPCSYQVNSLPPASQPPFSYYRVVSPVNNYDYAVTLFAVATPSLKSLLLSSSLALTSTDDGVGARAAPASSQPAPAPAAVAARAVWISAVAAGVAAACVAALLLARVVRRRRAAYAAKSMKIPVSLVN